MIDLIISKKRSIFRLYRRCFEREIEPAGLLKDGKSLRCRFSTKQGLRCAESAVP